MAFKPLKVVRNDGDVVSNDGDEPIEVQLYPGDVAHLMAASGFSLDSYSVEYGLEDAHVTLEAGEKVSLL